MLNRRSLLAAGAALGVGPGLALPAYSQGAAARTLRFVPQADLGGLDPIAISSNVIRNHAFMVWDTLYGLDAGFAPQPQMAAGHVVEQEGRSVTITLRPGRRAWNPSNPERCSRCHLPTWGTPRRFPRPVR